MKDVGNAIVTAAVNVKDTIANAFKEHPVATVTTAIGLTTVTAVGSYVAYCGLPGALSPSSSVINFAGMFSLPLSGLLVTHKKKRLYGILVGMLMLGLILSACGGGTPASPVAPPTGNALCPAAPTATPAPLSTSTATPEMIQSAELWLQSPNVIFSNSNLDASILNTQYQQLSYLSGWMMENQYWITQNYPGRENDMIFWQNIYNEQILAMAKTYNLNPLQLKGFLLKESQMALDPTKCAVMTENGQCLKLDENPKNLGASGLAQLTVAGMDTPFWNNANSEPYIRMAYDRIRLNAPNSLPFPLLNTSDTTLNFWSDFYRSYINSKDSKATFNDYSIRIADGICTSEEISLSLCNAYGEPVLQEGSNSVELAAQFLAYNKEELESGDLFSVKNWDTLSPYEQAVIYLSSYNGGLSCVSNSANAAMAAGEVNSWSQVTPYLSGYCAPSTVSQAEVYGYDSMCYASGRTPPCSDP